MLSDTRHLKRAAAFFLSSRAIHAFHTDGEMHSISIEAPDIILSEAKQIAAHALAEYLSGERLFSQPILVGVLVGLEAMRKADAMINSWEYVSYSLNALPALRQQAAEFARKHNNQIVRLANALIELKTVSTAQIAWLADSGPVKAAA
jgi:hypothetical protein